MKITKILSIGVIVVALLSCGKPQIIGTYQFSYQSAEGLSMVGQRIFNEDGTFSINFTTSEKENEYKKRTVKLSFSGSYSISENFLSEVIDISSIKIDTDNSDYRLADALLESLQQTPNSKTKIVEISKEQIILGESGEERVYSQSLPIYFASIKN